MDIKRSVTILLPYDADLRATVAAFQRVRQDLSEPCSNGGQPLYRCSRSASLRLRLSARSSAWIWLN
jgi:hypothetical protein